VPQRAPSPIPGRAPTVDVAISAAPSDGWQPGLVTDASPTPPNAPTPATDSAEIAAEDVAEDVASIETVAGPRSAKPTPRPAERVAALANLRAEGLRSIRPTRRPVRQVVAPPPPATLDGPATARIATAATLPGALDGDRTLLGIVRNGERREAILRTSDGAITRVAQGDRLGEWRVGAIFDDRVRLVGASGREVLRMPGG
jgi:hypothetical protein